MPRLLNKIVNEDVGVKAVGVVVGPILNQSPAPWQPSDSRNGNQEASYQCTRVPPLSFDMAPSQDCSQRSAPNPLRIFKQEDVSDLAMV